MNRKERLGLAWVTLNSWNWDDFVGEKPVGFDAMPAWSDDDANDASVKCYYISSKMQEIKSEIGEAACSRYWWKFALNKNYVQWILWYYPRLFICKLKRNNSFLY